MRSTSASYEASILSRAIDRGSGSWSPAVAQGILSIGLSPEDRERMSVLGGKATDGALEPDEELEIESYRAVCRLIELMKAKARASLCP